MKIRLVAFGNLRGPVMDVPENTGIRWKMALVEPAHAVVGFSGDTIQDIPPMPTMCEFEWNGKYEADTGARVYFLRDIQRY